MYKKVLLGFLFICFSTPLFAQNYEKEFATIFAWEVKQIDEFIERFNNQDATLIKQYALKNNNGKDFTREKMVKSLFDAQSKSWNFTDINAFIKEVNEQPMQLNFYDKDWYAKVDCAVTWNGKVQQAILILKLVVLPDSSSKWVISGVSSPLLKSASLGGAPVPASRDSRVSLNPVSHATDFMNISRVTENVVNIRNYFVPVEEQTEETKIFMQECAAGRMVIDRVTGISYHFLQLDGWIFEIRQFNRQTKNSGWLISKLIRAGNQDKEVYRTKQLMQ